MDELHDSDISYRGHFDSCSGGLEGRGGTTEDVAVLVLEEEVREDEDSHDVLGDGHLILGDEMVESGHEQFRDGVELNLELERGEVSNRARWNLDLVDKESVNVGSCDEIVDVDSTSELDVLKGHLDSELGGSVESRPELEVSRAVDSYILVSR